jgi:hypothetical protein
MVLRNRILWASVLVFRGTLKSNLSVLFFFFATVGENKWAGRDNKYTKNEHERRVTLNKKKQMPKEKEKRRVCFLAGILVVVVWISPRTKNEGQSSLRA